MIHYTATGQTHKIVRSLISLIIFVVSSIPILFSAEVHKSKENETGLDTWEWRKAGISIQFIQRLPDQTRAFFQARGFSSADSDRIANTCVFQIIFRNDGEQSLTYNLNEWKVIVQNSPYPILTREHWDTVWQQSEASQAAIIAFRWALLPTRQQFEPGDYNWGMTSFGAPSGETFDLDLVLLHNDELITSTVTDLICAIDQAGN